MARGASPSDHMSPSRRFFSHREANTEAFSQITHGMNMITAIEPTGALSEHKESLESDMDDDLG
ncbi:hypothetical protein UPYG_G00029740 [Umbra pygmaea]|uniref:Uncharacterized protein n=1 Tax=Umbra pygmaea TaxID=75934 RepID=A0ABD0XMM9_UMBPY